MLTLIFWLLLRVFLGWHQVVSKSWKLQIQCLCCNNKYIHFSFRALFCSSSYLTESDISPSKHRNSGIRFVWVYRLLCIAPNLNHLVVFYHFLKFVKLIPFLLRCSVFVLSANWFLEKAIHMFAVLLDGSDDLFLHQSGSSLGYYRRYAVCWGSVSHLTTQRFVCVAESVCIPYLKFISRSECTHGQSSFVSHISIARKWFYI